jgi:hypothetical protein
MHAITAPASLPSSSGYSAPPGAPHPLRERAGERDGAGGDGGSVAPWQATGDPPGRTQARAGDGGKGSPGGISAKWVSISLT